MKMMKKLLILAAVMILPIYFISCQKQSGTGTLSVSITDSPIDSANVSGVFITVTGVKVLTADSGWVTMTGFEGPKTYNLLDLTRGVSEALGNIELPSGSYTQIRLLLDAPAKGSPKPTSPGCYVEFKDGTTEALFVPSGSSSGYKAFGNFTVPVNGSVSVAADFDVRKSIHATGASSARLILTPVIRLVVTSQAGNIGGSVTNIPADSAIVIYTYASGTYTAEEAADPVSADSSRFPNAITSGKVDTTGVYHIAYLAPGNYDLVVTSSLNGIFGQVLGVVSGVAVTSGVTTTRDIDCNSLK
jgi:hypothetical protein